MVILLKTLLLSALLVAAVISPVISRVEDQMRYLNDLVPDSAAMPSAGIDKKETAYVYRWIRGECVDGDDLNHCLVMFLAIPKKVTFVSINLDSFPGIRMSEEVIESLRFA